MIDPRTIWPDAPPDAMVPPDAVGESPDGAPREGRERSGSLPTWEYDRVVNLLGREPNELELELFGAMWSEHCSYKNSRALLRRLPVEGERIVQGPGENAGAIRVGRRRIVFKIESHNSPSAVAPFDGAATGVGGILRDVFTMGARPVAVLDSLRFGPPDDVRQRELLAGVTEGVAAYARGMGVPNVGTEVGWDPGYARNPLVNAMAVGVAAGPLAKGTAAGPGNKVLVYGRLTGRDGVGSATFSSRALAGGDGEEAEGEPIPLIPAGDPDVGRRVMEATLALLDAGLLAGVQDMGAAGLTSSAAEMAAKAGTGMEIDTARVPTVDDGVSPEEVMLSETQERMLAVVVAGREQEARELLSRWDVPFGFCGVVTDDGVLRVKDGPRVLAAVPARHLVDDAPCYVRPLPPEPPPAEEGESAAISVGGPCFTEAFLDVLSRPNVGSRRRLRARYGQDETGIPRAAVVDLAGTPPEDGGDESAIAVCTYGNGRYVAADPYVGVQWCVAAAARRVAAAGARPVAVTNGLNFGSPENPAVYRQMERTISGLAEACRALGTPVTGGNVSLYNETDGVPVPPTPIIGAVGVLRDAASALPQGFQRAGDAIVLLGATRPGLAASEYAPDKSGPLAPPSLAGERRLYELMYKLAEARWPGAACAVADGGLAVALAYMAFAAAPGAAGCHVTLEEQVDVETALFGESPGRIVVAAPVFAANDIVGAATAAGVPSQILGRVVDGSFRFVDSGGAAVVEVSAADGARRWREAIPDVW